jgi:hypothetical protein
VAEVEKRGGVLIDDLDYFSAMTDQRRPPPEPRWLRTLFGESFFREVYFVGFLGKTMDDAQFAELSELPGIDRIPGINLGRTKITDESAKYLSRWSGLRELMLNETAITDASLSNLIKLRRLHYLNLDITKVTDDGVRKVRAAIPDCTISGKSKEEWEALRREAEENEKRSNPPTTPAQLQ